MRKLISRIGHILSRISGLSIPFFGISWTHDDKPTNAALARVIDLASEIVNEYYVIESMVEKMKAEFSKKEFAREDAVTAIQPITQKAADLRLRIHTKRYELNRFIEPLSVLNIKFLLAFAQLIRLGMSQDKEMRATPEDSPSLSENLEQIDGLMDALSGSIAICRKVLDIGVHALSDDEAKLFRYVTREDWETSTE